MSRGVEDRVELGREAMKRHAWEEARRLFTEADAAGELDAEGLRLLGKARSWCGDTAGTIDAFERSYAAFVAAGNRHRAAMLALMLNRQCVNSLGDVAAGRGWVQRAERLLEGEPEGIEHGYLWRVQARRAYVDGKPEAGRRLFERTIELGTRLGNRNVVAISLSWLGICLAQEGQTEEGYACLDEACAAAVGGELGPYAAGIVYCNTIYAYRDAGEFAMGLRWTETARRWCRRESIAGFSGICRIHRAEFMRLRGAWADAEREARLAGSELEESMPNWAGDAHYEVGEIRLRMGDLAGADEAFRRAHQFAREPQPGAALLLARQGQPSAALRSLESATLTAPRHLLDEVLCRAAEVEIACSTGELGIAERAVKRLDELVTERSSLGLRAMCVQSHGILELAKGDGQAHATLRSALRLWQEIEAPYEVAHVRLLLAEALRRADDEVDARRECEAALAAFEQLGARPDAERAKRLLEEPAPTQTVTQRTLFFSDIVGSTQLVEAIGDQAWTDLVAWLDGSLRQCFASHGGEEVDHAGDGFFVTFPDPKSALDCAVSIQRKLADHRRQHGFAPRIRIGVHATSATQTGKQYRGRGVHEASRIAALAGPDEILVSRETVPPGFALSGSRTVAVRGITKPVEVVRVDWGN